MTRRLNLAIAAVLLAAVPALAQTAAAQPLRIGDSGGVNTVAIPLLYARDTGLFRKAGLDVQLVDMVDDTTAVQALIAGEFPILYTGAGSGFTAQAHGADIKMVNAFAPWTDYQFVTVPELHTLQDLAGKALGVSRIGSVSYLAPVYVLQHAGVDISTIRFVAVGNDAARGRAIAARTIQGAVINGLDASRTLQADPSLHIIADVGSAFREVAMSNATFARGDFIKSQPAALQKVVTVLIQAARELQSNEAAAVAEALKVGLPADATQATYDRLYHAPVPYYGVDGGLDPVAIDSTVQLLKSSGGIDKTATLTAAQIVDPQFTAATLKALGPYGK